MYVCGYSPDWGATDLSHLTADLFTQLTRIFRYPRPWTNRQSRAYLQLGWVLGLGGVFGASSPADRTAAVVEMLPAVRAAAARASAPVLGALPVVGVCAARVLPLALRGRAFSSSSGSAPRALVLNAGSSSIKYGLFTIDAGASGGATAVCSGLVEKIGLQGGLITHKTADGAKTTMQGDLVDHSSALTKVVEILTGAGGPIADVKEIGVVGHRVVHGGMTLTAPAVLDDKVEAEIERCVPLAPLHNPANLNAIRVARSIFPAPHVAIFDTAFHADMPPESYTYALPRELKEHHGVRRYGFHGTSYIYVLGKAAEQLGVPKESLNAIICHLGNGASMAVVKNGKCLDTTMGLTPLEGLVMGTRAGDVDGGVLSFMAGHLGWDAHKIDTVLNKQSGLLGLCGTSDFRSVLAACEAGDEHAMLAKQVFVQRIRKYVGAYMVKLGGQVDALVFTGGIGENSAELRAEVCDGLASFGIALDASKNARALPEVQTSYASVRALVIPTNEELSIALQSAEAVSLVEPARAKGGARGAADGGADAQKKHKIVRRASFDPSLVKRPGPTAPSSPRQDDLALQAAADAAQAQMADSPAVEPLGHALFVEAEGASGLLEAALLASVRPRVTKLGYFQLLSYGHGHDRKLEYLRSIDKLGLAADPADAMVGMTFDEAMHLYASSDGRSDEIFDKIIDKFEAYAKGRDFVMVSGARVPARSTSVGDAPGSFAFYSSLASALDIPVLVVQDAAQGRPATTNLSRTALDGEPVETERLMAHLTAIKAGCEAASVRLAGAIMTGVPTANYPSVAAELRGAMAEHGIFPVALLPLEARVNQITMSDVAAALDAKVLYGERNLDSQVVRNVEVGTKQVPQLLGALQEKPGSLTITSATRSEVLMSMLLATQSRNVPLHPGILLTGAKELPEVVSQVLSGLDVVGKPVLLTEKTAYQSAIALDKLLSAAHALANTPSLTSHRSAAKLEAAESLLEIHMDKKFEAAMVQDNPAPDVTPIIFKHTMFSAARVNRQHIVLPEGNDVRVLTAAGELLSRGLCEITLLGNEDQVLSLAEKAHVDLSRAAIINPKRALLDEPTEWAEALVQGMHDARKAKGMTEPEARSLLMHDEAYFGTMMMMNGLADGMVSGACHSTANTMRPALQLIKMAQGYSMVSSVFFMLLRDRVFVYGDCAINVDPSAEELAEIALASAGTARAFGITPRIAMLSYATGDSNQGPMIDKVRKATELARERAPAELIEGPIQFDAAVDPAVAAVKFKGQDSPVAGKATVCIFPDLNAGNNAYKAVQQASKASAVGPIMQGLRLPVNDLSRGCTVDDIVNTVVCTALQSIAAKEAAARGGGGSK